MARTVYVVVNTEGTVGAAEWRDDVDDLPRFSDNDEGWVVTVPARHADDDAAITEQMDCFLGDYDLPEDYEVGPYNLGPMKGA